MALAIANVAASSTDSELVAAVSGKSVQVDDMVLSCGATATTIVFNSKVPSQAPVALTPTISQAINAVNRLPIGFKGAEGAALTCTTGAGSTTGIMLNYRHV